VLREMELDEASDQSGERLSGWDRLRPEPFVFEFGKPDVELPTADSHSALPR
jgi:hypothetical protein